MALNFLNNGYFGGKLGIGTDSPKQQLHVSGGTTAGDVTKMVIGATGGNAESYLYLAELFSGDNVNYGFAFVADGNSSNNLLFKRHSNSTSGTTVMEIRRDSDQIRFNGYSGTNQTGTPTYILGTTNSGDIVKVLGANIPGVPAGSGANKQVTYWTGTDTIGGDDGFKYELNSSNNVLLDLSSTGSQQIRFFDTNSTYTESMRLLRFDDKLVMTYGDNANEEALTVVGTGSTAGNVGIGTTSPAQLLSIYKDSGDANFLINSNNGASQIFFGDTESDNIGNIRYDHASNYMRFSTNASERMRIDSAGNVGIGKTPQARNVLDIQRNDTLGSFITHRNDLGFALNRTYADYGNDGDTVEYQERIGVDGNNSSIGNYSNHTLAIRTNNQNRITILSGGNVGIGETSPGSLLSLRKEDNTVYDPTSDDGQRAIGPTILLNNNSTTTNTFGQIMYDTDFSGQGVARIVFLDAGTASSAIAFVTEQSDSIGERMRIDPVGNVGIGTASPLGRLQVNEYTVASQGNQGVHGEVSVFANNGDESLFLGLRNSAYPNRGWALNPVAFGINSSLQIKEHGSTAVRMTIESGGNVGIGVTDPTEKLHLQSTTSGCFVRFADNTASGVYVGARANELEIYAGNAERFGIDANGVVRFNAYGTGILQTDTNGVISANLSPLVDDIIFNNGASITNQINTDVDTGTETVANVAIATYTAAFFDFVIKKTTNVRSGTVYACHDGTNVEFTETSTQDLGDTSDVTLSVDISGGNMRLRATTTSDNWSVKSLIRAI